MTGKAHRRLEYALILAGIVLVGAICAWAADGVSGNWRVGGDLVVSQDGSFGRDVTITDDLFVTDDSTFSSDVAISGAVTLADSCYTAADMTFAAEQVLRVEYLGLMEVTGAFPDTLGLPAGTLAFRGDTLFVLVSGKGSWDNVNAE